MQRLFSTFPAGPPAAGLLLLRLTAGSLTLAEALLRGWHSAGPLELALEITSILAALSLIAGLLTPLAAVVLASTNLVHWWLLGTVQVSPPHPLMLAIVAVAVALVGPGAISVDARVFGRREIVIPKRER